MRVAKSKKALIFGLIIAATAIVFVVILLSGTKEAAEVSISDTEIEISGQYGIVYQIQDVDEVRLEDTIPKINRKVNGSSIGGFKKGDFDVEGLGICRLFIHSDSGPYVYIRIGDSYCVINAQDSSQTQQLFDVLSKAVE